MLFSPRHIYAEILPPPVLYITPVNYRFYSPVSDAFFSSKLNIFLTRCLRTFVERYFRQNPSTTPKYDFCPKPPSPASPLAKLPLTHNLPCSQVQEQFFYFPSPFASSAVQELPHHLANNHARRWEDQHQRLGGGYSKPHQVNLTIPPLRFHRRTPHPGKPKGRLHQRPNQNRPVQSTHQVQFSFRRSPWPQFQLKNRIRPPQPRQPSAGRRQRLQNPLLRTR